MAMSTDPDSRISSPVSLTATPSMLSELDRLRDGKHDGGGLPQGPPSDDFRMPEAVSPYPSEPPPMPSISDSPTIIDLGDGDMELKVNNTVFKTHKHLLNDFSRLKEIIKGMERCNAFGSNGVPCVAVYRDERGVEDFRNMFKILYASLIKGPFEFDAPILVSALRIATAYDYPELRKFSIERLDKLSLSAIQRIELAREFDLTAWKETAYKELCSREEAITKEEARALGADMMEEIAKAREEEKQKKAKEIGVQEEKARREAEEQAKREAEEKARKEEEERLKREEEERLKREAEEKARQEEQAKKEAEEKAKQEAEAQK